MARKTSKKPFFQIWRQWHGSSHEPLAEFHSLQAAMIFLDDMKRREEMRGKQCHDNESCGFTSYVGTTEDMSPRAHYWWDVAMSDEAINSESPPILQEILDKFAEAMLIGAVEGKARREAAASGINFEPDEDS